MFEINTLSAAVGGVFDDNTPSVAASVNLACIDRLDLNRVLACRLHTAGQWPSPHSSRQAKGSGGGGTMPCWSGSLFGHDCPFMLNVFSDDMCNRKEAYT